MHPVFTIGHSTRSIDEFIDLLKENHIHLLVDVRRFPGSKRHPQFNHENLAQSLQEAGIDYRHMEVLGGRREIRDKNSRNNGWRNEGFQAYADYLNTNEGQEACQNLVEQSKEVRLAIMCAESVYWRCHRRLIADALVARDVEVYHIMGIGRKNTHTLNDMARILDDGQIIYPSRQQRLFGD